MHSASPIKIKNQTLTKICHEFYLRTWWDYLAKSMMVMARFLWILGFFTSFSKCVCFVKKTQPTFFGGEWKLWIFFGGRKLGQFSSDELNEKMIFFDEFVPGKLWEN